MKNNDIEEKSITFEGKHINGQALDILYDFSINKFLSKTRPGIGVTTALLNCTKGNLLIISPLTPMIQKKETHIGQYKSQRQFFKCTDIHSQWSDVLDYFRGTPLEQQNLVINTTPDAICGLYDYNAELFNELIKIPVVVDEYDTLVLQSQLREECGRFLELMYSNWKATYTFTTATPNYNYLDVPEPTQMSFYKVGPLNPPDLEIGFSNNFKEGLLEIYYQLEMGRKVVCFSNNINVHKRKFTELQKSMAGDNLNLRLEYYDVETGSASEEDLLKNSDMGVFSGKYYVGFDIEEDVFVVVISEANHPATTTSVNMVIQALHRCRGEKLGALFVNSRLNSQCHPDPEVFIREQQAMENELQYFKNKAANYKWNWEIKKKEPITPELICNRALIASGTINKIAWMQLHDDELLEKEFNKYGVILIPYSPPDIDLPEDTPKKFNERILNCMKVDAMTMEGRYERAVSRLRFSKQGSHNPHRAMERLTALLIRKMDYKELTKKLDNPKLKPLEFYDYLDKFLQRNYPVPYLVQEVQRTNQCLGQVETIPFKGRKEIDEKYLYQWHLFYAAFKILKNKIPPPIDRYVAIRKTAGNMDILEEFKDEPQRFDLAFQKVQEKLSGVHGPLTPEEEIKVKGIIEKRYTNDEDKKFGVYSAKALKGNILNALYFLINPAIPLETINGRQTNPFTLLFKVFRPLIPIDLLLIDINSANAQFIDIILQSNMSDVVYQNIMKNLELDRNSSKKQFGHVCNSHYLSRPEATTYFHTICEYPLDKAQELAALTAQVPRGSFYRRMTSIEHDYIKLYNQQIDKNGVRLHDGLVVAPWYIQDPIPVMLNNVKFSVTYFRTDLPYVGVVDENNRVFEHFII